MHKVVQGVITVEMVQKPEVVEEVPVVVSSFKEEISMLQVDLEQSMLLVVQVVTEAGEMVETDVSE